MSNDELKPLILIVDDVAKNLQVLGSILYDNGYEIAMADNGRTAMELLEQITPDLILLDIMMPEMDGFEVCKKIGCIEKFQNVPIIYLTAKSETDNIVKGFKTGASDYITKPFNSEELLARVKTHIDLKKSKELLHKVNQRLEEKVAERTAQLKTANDKLLKLDTAKSYFLGLLSHELNTPITGILGSVDLLTSDEKSEEKLELLNFISDSTARLKKFSELSLLITRLKTDKYEMQLVEENIYAIIQESFMSFEDIIKELDITMQKEIDDEEIFLNLDYGLVRKCFDVIIENSIKYSGKSSTIGINLQKNENQVVITMKDTGPGFSKDMLENAFNVFNSDELMHHKDGYGLGLATAELIMQAHSGNITIDNNPEGGAFVKLAFPFL